MLRRKAISQDHSNYPHKCEVCGYLEEDLSFKTFLDAVEKIDCPKCKAKGSYVRQFPCNTGVVYKAKGYYITDVRDKERGNSESSSA